MQITPPSSLAPVRDLAGRSARMDALQASPEAVMQRPQAPAPDAVGGAATYRSSASASTGAASHAMAGIKVPTPARLDARQGDAAALSHLKAPSVHMPAYCAGITPLIETTVLQDRVRAMAARITEDYRDKEQQGIVALPVYHGAAMFYADLVRQIPLDLVASGVSLQSYGNERVSCGTVTKNLEANVDLQGKHVLIVEDIVDTGRTLHHYLQELHAQQVASAEIVTLLTKPSQHVFDLKPKYVGFEIDNHFVVGYGLDDAGRFRNLPFVGMF